MGDEERGSYVLISDIVFIVFMEGLIPIPMVAGFFSIRIGWARRLRIPRCDSRFQSRDGRVAFVVGRTGLYVFVVAHDQPRLGPQILAQS